MKCAACGYDEAIPFLHLHSLVDKQGRNQVLYACPTCGTVRLENPTAGEMYNKYHWCKCPWCGNTHPDEFEILSTQDKGNIIKWHKSVICSCGVCGPCEDTAEKAIERFRAWGKK